MEKYIDDYISSTRYINSNCSLEAYSNHIRSISINKFDKIIKDFVFMKAKYRDNDILLGYMFKSFDIEYVVIGPTYNSSDGEYKERLLLLKGIKATADNPIICKFKDYYVNMINHKKLTFIPYATGCYKDAKHDDIMLEIIALSSIYANMHVDNKYIKPGFLLLYGDVIDIVTRNFKSSQLIQLRNDVAFNCGLRTTGIKLLPLYIKDIENPLNTNYKNWRELNIQRNVVGLALCGICDCFSLLCDWFIIDTNTPELWDNHVNQIKIRNSNIAEYILQELESTRKLTINPYKPDKHISYSFEGLSDLINTTINYSEKELILCNKVLAIVSTYAGFTMANYDNMFTKYLCIYTNYKVFMSYMFVMLYSVLALHVKLKVVHSDLHMNNITLKQVTIFKTKPDTSPHIIFDTGKRYLISKMLYLPCIIDFSRSCTFEDSKRRILATWKQEMPELFAEVEDKLQILSISNYEAYYVIFSAIDIIKIAKSLMFLLDSVLESDVVHDKQLIKTELKSIVFQIEEFTNAKIRKNIELALAGESVIDICYDVFDEYFKMFEDVNYSNHDLPDMYFPNHKISICNVMMLKNSYDVNVDLNVIINNIIGNEPDSILVKIFNETLTPEEEINIITNESNKLKRDRDKLRRAIKSKINLVKVFGIDRNDISGEYYHV
jgi:hypothetical protein